MSDYAFWRTSPRQLAALSSAHIEANQSPSDSKSVSAGAGISKDVVRKGYIDEVW